ncbi:MAG: ABC transporter substrate-binding protein [Streptosporangiales bacterium]|nr:ABC transporter substrate-binding protein [Streptosporangiales bacterium]
MALTQTHKRVGIPGLAACLAAGLALALTACAPAGSGKDAKGDAAPGKFVVARTADIDQLDPHKATAFQTIATLGLVYDRLVTVDKTGRLTPGLAEKWTAEDGGRTLTFTLRKGVTWHDGEAFDSADVKASLDRILEEKTGAVARSNLTVIDGVDTPDATTVKLNLTRPSTALLYALTSVNAAILDEADIEKDTVGKEPDGTGPFAWKSWNQGQNVTLTGNPKYFGGAPAIKTLEFRTIPAESSILAGMKAGAFQLGLLSDPSVAQQATGNDAFRLVKQPSLAYHALMLNGRKGPLEERAVRQAIACAIDPGQVVQTAAYGDGAATGPITSPAYRYSTTEGLPCTPGNAQQAKDLLAQGGHPDGVTLETIVMTDGYSTAVAEAQNVQAQLAKIGVKLELKQLTTAPYVKAWVAADFDAAIALNGGSYDPYLMYGRYFTDGGSLAKAAGLDSPKISELLARGDEATDDATRQATYKELQRELLTESPWAWMSQSADYYLVGTGVEGFEARPDQALSSLASAKNAG